jgi:predicted metal-binding protein
MDGGYGPQGKDTLRSILREAIREAGHRRDVRVVDARCLGICPRKAVTVINASNPGMVFIVPAGMSSARALKLVIGPAD